MFSRDTYSYLAQGALLRDGFDPYAVGPVANPNSLLDNVSQSGPPRPPPTARSSCCWPAVTTLTGDNVIAGTCCCA